MVYLQGVLAQLFTKQQLLPGSVSITLYQPMASARESAHPFTNQWLLPGSVSTTFHQPMASLRECQHNSSPTNGFCQGVSVQLFPNQCCLHGMSAQLFTNQWLLLCLSIFIKYNSITPHSTNFFCYVCQTMSAQFFNNHWLLISYALCSFWLQPEE